MSQPLAETVESRRVLIADDNRDWADALATLLQDEGYTVCTTYDGRQALEAARSFQPHIVLLDIRMPHMTGYEAARVFDRNPAKTRPVLIAMTGTRADAESASIRARMTGFDHYLPKPTEASAILELLRKV
jgi:CheY-like chemotaxis protein